MAAAAGGIIGGLLGSESQAGQKETVKVGQTSQSGPISNAGRVSNAGNQQAIIQNAQVQPAASNAPQVTSSNSGGNGNLSWEQLAQMAKSLNSKEEEEPKPEEKTKVPVML